MKVFDVTFRNDVCLGRAPIPVFAEDTAQATRVAVKFVNKKRSGYVSGPYGNIILGSRDTTVEELTAEDVVKVEVIRDQVAS